MGEVAMLVADRCLSEADQSSTTRACAALKEDIKTHLPKLRSDMKRLVHYRKPKRGEKSLLMLNESLQSSSPTSSSSHSVYSTSKTQNNNNTSSSSSVKKNIEFGENNGGASSPKGSGGRGGRKQGGNIEPRGWDAEPERETGAMIVLRDDGLCMQIPKKDRGKGGGEAGGKGGNNKIVSRHCQHVPSDSDLGALSLGVGSMNASTTNPTSHFQSRKQVTSFKSNFNHNGSNNGGSGGGGGASMNRQKGSGHIYKRGSVGGGGGGGPLMGAGGGGSLDFGLTGTSVHSGSQLLMGNDEISSRLLDSIKTSQPPGIKSKFVMDESSNDKDDSKDVSGGDHHRVDLGIAPPPSSFVASNSSESNDIASRELAAVIDRLGEGAQKFCNWYRSEEGKDPTAALVENVLSQVPPT
eukprot:CAMPEP_0114353000 /NCGR_PEP_ID=MMETSP0101-20121206/18349_1 /TAXON_ID=38822 ORGANISM="Pteridomonas danica, Strain PT" /NCGR_SAMPLE_ID=MMETSP0101 /ASSEMBLY_ACC=CAM_ASM_000211 /LENGTH=409 /DNA_ID=CAMNT_0001493645 /DNA_START=502 /DNA_END=1731 /DNA_ORIENTATION=-